MQAGSKAKVAVCPQKRDVVCTLPPRGPAFVILSLSRPTRIVTRSSPTCGVSPARKFLAASCAIRSSGCPAPALWRGDLHVVLCQREDGGLRSRISRCCINLSPATIDTAPRAPTLAAAPPFRSIVLSRARPGTERNTTASEPITLWMTDAHKGDLLRDREPG